MISRSYGRLIYLSTGLSRRPREGMITLGTAKAALDQFVRYVALELAPHGITANLVAPATVDETKVTEQLTMKTLANSLSASVWRQTPELGLEHQAGPVRSWHHEPESPLLVWSWYGRLVKSLP